MYGILTFNIQRIRKHVINVHTYKALQKQNTPFIGVFNQSTFKTVCSWGRYVLPAIFTIKHEKWTLAQTAAFEQHVSKPNTYLTKHLLRLAWYEKVFFKATEEAFFKHDFF